MSQYKEMTIENLSEGAVMMSLDAALKDVLKNIGDTTTENGVREINLKVKFKPAEDRSETEVSVTCATKLQLVPIVTHAEVSTGIDGTVTAYEIKTQQLGLPFATSRPAAAEF
jgi:hypothetical protein